MAVSNRDRVGQMLELVGTGLESSLSGSSRARTGAAGTKSSSERRRRRGCAFERSVRRVYFLLKLMWSSGTPPSERCSVTLERTYVSELRDIRNRWAHQEAFSTDDTYRALDTVSDCSKQCQRPRRRD